MFPTAVKLLFLYVASALSSPSPTDLGQRSTPSVAAAYYAGWHNGDFPLTDVSWNKYTHMIYAFAETVPDPSQTPNLNGSDPDMLLPFVQAAHENNVTAMLSVGGWTGSLHFSTNVGSAANRTAFVKSVVGLAQNYSLDGLDFDWEYPGTQGIGCNAIGVNDTANFLLFLQELRQDPIGKNLVISAPTSINPWVDATGSASTDVSGFSQVFDFITIMNYDIWGPWSATAGPNAPLYDLCESKDLQQGSAITAVQAWNEAGMPLDQIVLGVASYGHSFSVATSSAFGNGTDLLETYPAFNASIQPVGDSWDNASGNDVCGNPQGPGGDMDFWGLIKGGWLTEEGVVADGIAYAYDQCDRTPRVYNETTQDYIAFDDAASFSEKGEFIKVMGLRGFGIWEAGGDYKDILLDSIRSSSGFH